MSEFTQNERNALALTAVGHFGAHFAMLVFPTVAVLISREEGIALETVLGWSFLGYLLFGLGALPVGVVSDSMRARWVVRSGVVGIGAAMMATSLASPGVSLTVALASVGVFASLYHPAGLGLLSRTVAARGTALGINGVFGNLGIAAAPLAAQFAAQAFGWRGAYLALGAVLMTAGVFVSLLPIDEPAPGELTGDDEHHPGSERMVLFGILLVAMTMGGLSYRANTVAQPAYYDANISFVGHGVATTIAYALGTVGQYVGGRLADRYDLRLLYVGFHAASLPFVLAMAVLTELPLLAAASVFVFFSLGMQPIENSLVARFTPDRWRATGYGLKFAVVFGIGALSVGGVRAVLARTDLAFVFVGIGGLVAVLVCIAGYLAWRTRAAPILNLP